jgi:hypothetical protein
LFRAIKATHLHALHLVCWFSGNARCEVNRKKLSPIFGKKSHPTLAGKKRLPGGFDICAQGSCSPEACYYYATIRHSFNSNF